jgi:hypothetical protein
MKIRSITYFCNPQYPLDEAVLRKAGEFLVTAKSAYVAAGYEVQTTRMATIPFSKLLNGKVNQLPLLAEKLSKLLPQIGLAYAALGPALIEFPESYAVIPEAISAGENIFFGGVMADKAYGISL